MKNAKFPYLHLTLEVIGPIIRRVLVGEYGVKMEAQSVEVTAGSLSVLTICVAQHCVKEGGISKTANRHVGSGIYFPRHLQQTLRPRFYFWKYLKAVRTSQVMRIKRL